MERALGQARPAAAYVMPDFQNPTGLLLDQRQREWLARALARAGTRAAVAERHGLRLAAGPRFGTGHAFDDRLRLPFTQPPEQLRRAVDLLAAADTDAAGAPTASRGPLDPVV